MFVLDLLLLARTPMIFPDPGMQRVFIHSQVARGLGNRLIRLDRQFHGAFLECSGILLRSGLTHRTHLLGCVLSLVSVCPVEYNHIIVSGKKRERKVSTGVETKAGASSCSIAASHTDGVPRRAALQSVIECL